MTFIHRTLILFTILILALSACTAAGNKASGDVPETIPTPQQENPVYFVWLPPYLPQEIRNSLASTTQFRMTERKEQADLIVDVGEDLFLSEWIYCLVAPFPTIADGITTSELRSLWQGGVEEDFNARD